MTKPIYLFKIAQEFLQVERAELTNKQYKVLLNSLIKSLGGECDLRDITYAVLLNYLDGLRTYKTRRGKPLSELTIRNHVTTLKAFFNWAVTIDYLQQSPAAHLKTRRKTRAPEKSRAIPPDELANMIAACKGRARNYALMLFLADTGCRVGGLCSLTLDNLDLDDRSALICEKGGHWQRVLYGEQTAEALRRWLAKRPAADHDFVWTGKRPDYRPLHREGVAALVKTLAALTGASQIWTPHSIRHAVGHALAKQGIPVSVVQRKLNHASPDITARVYFPRDDAYLRQVSDTYSLAAVGQVTISPKALDTLDASDVLPFD